ncbi:MAG: hydantoinase/oxoprolinase family protein [Betaproteobacteria bacterium]|nr:hydantoinase/oxoprolinase family protein [Betaproteobacteria bacterium]
MSERKTYRIGIDVGGTFTKAVLIDNAGFEVVGRYSVLTTHSDVRGVAAGVVEVFRNVLERSQVDPKDVVFLAHSTTQATNALLEGDVAAVGVIGMASRVESVLARGQSNVKDIELAPGRFLRPSHRFITTDKLDEALVRQTLEALRDEGMQVVVASSAFGVDDQSAEELVIRIATELGLAVTGGHEITKLYGLTTRTRTAVINASILPKMIGTANMTEEAVREAGIAAPLMIMRGDGGVMDVQEMRRRPVVTMLSGPAASVAGALMYLRVSDGIYFEVGGTSTNIGVIRNGRPTIKHARVGGHDTYVNSLDVRVIGIAGGSMVRVRGNDIHDVGPRSAHIAGLHYAAFAKAEDIVDPRIELFRPKDGDPDDYLAIRCSNGERYALTNTCAANILGYAKPGWHAHGNAESARRAFAPLAQRIGSTIEEAARRVLVKAAAKVTGVVEDLVEEYKLDRDQAVLVGEGGGAASLIPFVAETMKLDFNISRDAEVISSIGVALALVRETIERVIPNPGPEDLQRIKREAFDAAVKLGAAPENVEVVIEVDPQMQRVRATAMGASEMRAQDLRKQVSEEEAAGIAATSMGLTTETVKLAAATDGVRVFQAEVKERKWHIFTTRRTPVRAVDREGVIRIQRSDGVVRQASASDGLQQLRSLWESVTIYNGDSVIAPDMFVVAGRRIVDLSGITALDQAIAISRGELEGLPPEAPVVLISMQGARGL